MMLADTKDVEPDLIGNLHAFRRLAIRSVGDGILPVAGSGKIAAKLSIPISMTGNFPILSFQRWRAPIRNRSGPLQETGRSRAARDVRPDQRAQRASIPIAAIRSRCGA